MRSIEKFSLFIKKLFAFCELQQYIAYMDLPDKEKRPMKKLRTYAIVDYLKEKKYCSIPELIEHFQVSGATMYRDIAELTSRDVVKKVHGGIALNTQPAVRQTPGGSPFQERILRNREKKEELARQALEKVEENDILFLDSSTTVYYLALLLEKSAFSNLTIVTNSVTIIQEFHKFPPHYVRIALGGSYDVQLNSFLGQATLRELEYLEISKAFISAFGAGNDKATTNHEHHASLLIKVLGIAAKKYLLADRSKLDRTGLFRIAPHGTFDEILSSR